MTENPREPEYTEPQPAEDIDPESWIDDFRKDDQPPQARDEDEPEAR
jgi:hypothetical protein